MTKKKVSRVVKRPNKRKTASKKKATGKWCLRCGAGSEWIA